jgi:hypothetical protein
MQNRLLLYLTASQLLHRCCCIIICCCRSYPLLKGDTDLLKLLKLLQPKVLVPLLNADLDQEGKLTSLMSVRGSSLAADVRQQLAAAGAWSCPQF